MNLTPIEILDLKRLVERIERESKDRVVVKVTSEKFGPATALRFSDSAIEAGRVLPVLKKVLEPLFLVEKTPAPSRLFPEWGNSKEVSQPDTKTIHRRFGVGDSVTWWSQAGGSFTFKRGRVASIVPPNKFPGDCFIPCGCRLRSPIGKRRDHESYLVKVEGLRTLYWPLTKYLGK